ncbi:MAG: hypothetical protein PHT00_01470 [Candidatus Methanomethylophilus sp.]|nr:hypothetical protein [Methanomethylophilus sp.]MDD4669028.1 hypothetical protein [Methanomethylophilus sp.]
MNYLFGLAAVFAFAPALLLMYGVLRKYTYPAVEQPFFSDPYFFGLFTGGLIIGTVLLLVYTYVLNFILYVLLYAVIQVLAVVIVLNLRRFRGKSDSVFYGFGVGLGAGAATAMGFIYYLIIETGLVGENVDALTYVWLFVVGVSMVLQYAAVGTNVGEGIARHRPLQYASEAIVYNLVYMILLFMMMKYGTSWSMIFVFAAMALAVAAGYCYYADVLKLKNVVRDVLRMEGKKRDDLPK